MPKPKKVKFKDVVDGAEFPFGRPATVPIIVEPDDPAGGGGGGSARTGVSVRLFFKRDGVPFQQIISEYVITGNNLDERAVTFTPMRGSSQSIRVTAWNRRQAIANGADIQTKRLRIKVVSSGRTKS